MWLGTIKCFEKCLDMKKIDKNGSKMAQKGQKYQNFLFFKKKKSFAMNHQ